MTQTFNQTQHISEILHSIFECITQLRKENDSGFSKEIQSALDSLISVVYNLSRLDGMRRIGKTNDYLIHKI